MNKEKVIKLKGIIMWSGDIIKILEKEAPKHEKIILYFEDVEFISRTAVAGLLKYIKKHNLNVEFINMNQSVKKMLDIVKKQL